MQISLDAIRQLFCAFINQNKLGAMKLKKFDLPSHAASMNTFEWAPLRTNFRNQKFEICLRSAIFVFNFHVHWRIEHENYFLDLSMLFTWFADKTARFAQILVYVRAEKGFN